MKKIKNYVTIIIMCFFYVYSFTNVFAEGIEYSNKGQTTFYGEYIYPSEEEKEQQEQQNHALPQTNDKNFYDSIYSQRAQTPSSINGQAILPATGDRSLVWIQKIGVSLFLGLLILLINRKHMVKEREI